MGVLTALRRHWLTALLPFVLLVGAAIELGLRRTPQYTATADLSVGTIFVTNPIGIASAIQGTESLAAVYSRVVHADAVDADTARRLAERSLPNAGRVSATPIAESPMLRLTAVASSERQAVALANAASAALADYVNDEAQSQNDATVLSRRYRRAALRYRQSLRVKSRLARRYTRDPTAEHSGRSIVPRRLRTPRGWSATVCSRPMRARSRAPHRGPRSGCSRLPRPPRATAIRCCRS
jgi:hypothetical protein